MGRIGGERFVHLLRWLLNKQLFTSFYSVQVSFKSPETTQHHNCKVEKC